MIVQGNLHLRSYLKDKKWQNIGHDWFVFTHPELHVQTSKNIQDDKLRQDFEENSKVSQVM